MKTNRSLLLSNLKQLLETEKSSFKDLKSLNDELLALSREEQQVLFTEWQQALKEPAWPRYAKTIEDIVDQLFVGQEDCIQLIDWLLRLPCAPKERPEHARCSQWLNSQALAGRAEHVVLLSELGFKQMGHLAFEQLMQKPRKDKRLARRLQQSLSKHHLWHYLLSRFHTEVGPYVILPLVVIMLAYMAGWSFYPVLACGLVGLLPATLYVATTPVVLQCLVGCIPVEADVVKPAGTQVVEEKPTTDADAMVITSHP